MADDHSNVSGETKTTPGPDVLVKKPFEAPRLTVYGDIATLTKAVGRTGSSDNGHTANNRTRP